MSRLKLPQPQIGPIFQLIIVSMVVVSSNHFSHKYVPSYTRNAEVSEGSDAGLKLSKYDRMDLAMEMEVSKTMDPSLGIVPYERMKDAWEAARRTANSRAAISGLEWIERGPNNFGGRTRAIMFDPNDGNKSAVFAGAVAGGLWKTTNIYAQNPEWEPVNDLFDNLSIVSIAYDSAAPTTMYFGTGEGYYNVDAVRGNGIWKSTDGGSTWSQLSSTVTTNHTTTAGTGDCNFDYVNKIIVSGQDTILAACKSHYTNRGGIMRSTDGGSSWTRVLPATGTCRAADIERAKNGDLYAALGIFNTDGIYKSTDNGATWTKLTGGGLPASGYERIELACAPSDANKILAIMQDASANDCYGIYQSSDGGANWSSLTVPTQGSDDFTRGQAWYDLIAAYDPNDDTRIFIGGIDLWLSENSGTSWTEISHWYGQSYQEVHADQHAIAFASGSSDTILFGNDGGIFLCEDGSGSSPDIANRNMGYNVTQFYACAIHPTANSNFFLAGAQDNGSHRFTHAGECSTVEVTGGDGAFCHIDQDDPTYMFTAYVYSYFRRSTDGGNTFSNVNYSGSGNFISQSDYDNDADILYSSYNSGEYLRWNNPQTGTNFTEVNMSFTGQVSAVTCDPNTSNKVWFGTESGYVYYVTNAHNGSASSTDVTDGSMPSGEVSCIEIDPGDANHVLVVFSNFGVASVWETTDGGSNWTDVEGNLPDMPIRWALFNPNNTDQALLATEAGVWSTDNLNGGSTSWASSNTGLANVRVDMLQYRSSDNLVIAATHGRGLYSSDVFTSANAAFGSDKTVAYINKDIRFYDDSYQASTYLWNFGDGNTSTLQNPTHSYTTAGDYTVTLSINLGADSEVKTDYIRILPNRNIPYNLSDGGNFDVNRDDFGAENFEGTPFESGSSAVSNKNGTRSGSYAWVTDLTAVNYDNYTHTELLSPNFNFTTSGTYTLEFYAKYRTETGWDGFRLEYSTDKGDSWYPIGTTSFYNTNNTTQTTSFLYGEPYFSGSYSSSFNQYTLNVSSLAGNANVAFKLVFKADALYSYAGAAFDDFTVDGPSTVLPVFFEQFIAYPDDDEAQLKWQTAFEENSKGFIVQRSEDGVQFDSIGYVASHNISGNDGLAYRYTDPVAAGGDYYYRLKQLDNNGSVQYSVIRMVSFAKQEISLKIFPNPTSGETYFILNNAGDYKTLNIFSMSGEIVHSRTIMQKKRGTVTIDFSTLPKGVYLVVASGDSQNAISRKVIVY